MSFADQVFVYCERGLNPGFLAEPVNAVTNAAFVVAGLALFVLISRRAPSDRRLTDYVLAALVVLIGLGSFLFHTYATIWSAIADVAPIAVFMLVYFAIALRRFLRVPVAGVAALTAGFAFTLWASRFVRCGPDVIISISGEGERCLNGSIGYVPALLAVIVIGTVLVIRRQAVGGRLLAAGGIFAMSLTFRTIDAQICPHTVIAGYTLGSHFMWHLLNALTLLVLMRAAITYPVDAKVRSATGGYSWDRRPHADLRQRN